MVFFHLRHLLIRIKYSKQFNFKIDSLFFKNQITKWEWCSASIFFRIFFILLFTSTGVVDNQSAIFETDIPVMRNQTIEISKTVKFTSFSLLSDFKFI
ncbi:hypothetical protein A8L51_21970 [Pantoea stewartii]|nr:hypothetical protein [Pantoea stewartii]